MLFIDALIWRPSVALALMLFINALIWRPSVALILLIDVLI